mmetsp:Transcript_37047/g.95672  ORF Transcript_37047/g.95672 Transcript_37047/m.95672 type:complete len:189 (+) Transcript_37047:1138-1704(+)
MLSNILSVSVYAFPIVAVVSSIPVFSIVVKYNMIEAGSSRTMATFMGVVLPWVVAFPLLEMPNALGQLVNFTSLFFVSFTDFIVPVVLYAYLHRPQWKLGGNSASASSSIPELESPVSSVSDRVSVSPQAHRHDAFPVTLRDFSPEVRVACALFIAVVLAVASVVAMVLSLMQGSWTLDEQTCALVGQ